MHQIKFYRVETLPEQGEVGSLYFVHEDATDFNNLYVCTASDKFESYSGYTFWSDGIEGEEGEWGEGGSGEAIDLSKYLEKTGGTMTGTIVFKNADMLKHNDANILQYNETDSSLCLGENTGSYTKTITLSANEVISPGNINASAFYETSDIRKKDIKSDLSIDKCYNLLNTCQTIIYSLKEQDQNQVGMIAQEIEEFFPEVVATDENGFKSLAYDRLVVIVFKMLKDMVQRLEKLENV